MHSILQYYVVGISIQLDYEASYPITQQNVCIVDVVIIIYHRLNAVSPSLTPPPPSPDWTQ